MKRWSIINSPVLLLTIATLFMSGCGQPSGPARFKVKGEVTNNGEPLKVNPHVGSVQVTLYPVTEPGAPAADPQEATVAPTGELTVHGTDGKGILPGTYKIAVRQWDEPNKDVLKGAGDKDHTKIVREIKSSSDPIIIDVKDIINGTAK
jgi:hypothetical protein